MQVTYTEKTGKTKIRVELDNGDSFVMNERDWNRLDLNTGESVDESRLYEFYRDYFLPKAKQKALNLLRMRDRSRLELEQKLRYDGYPGPVIRETFAYIDQYHYLDDRRFAKNYIEYRKHKKSRRELEYELSLKGIHLGELVDEEDTLPDDQETIRNLILKKWGEEPAPDMKEKERMIRYLGRHGFHMSDIRKVYRDLGI